MDLLDSVTRFDCFVCSPTWLADNFADEDLETGETALPWAHVQPEPAAQFTPSMILMASWSRDALLRALDGICEECAGPNSGVVMIRLSRYLDWEYEIGFDEYLDSHAAIYDLPHHWTAVRNRPPGT
jgi:hypothetical protein